MVTPTISTAITNLILFSFYCQKGSLCQAAHADGAIVLNYIKLLGACDIFCPFPQMFVYEGEKNL